MKLLKLPINENHIQNRINRLAEDLYEADLEAIDDVLFHVEQYLLKLSETYEANDCDPWQVNNAAFRIAEGRYWLGLMLHEEWN